jgi:dethiobiotin synthetase
LRGYIVAGIGTEIGKTIVAATVVEKLGADYWKPVQAGELNHTDTMTVGELAPGCGTLHTEAYRLNTAMSPHAAAEIDGVTIVREDLSAPATENVLVIEMAGGLLVPLAPGLSNIDLMADWGLPVILVSAYYLGSINHTLLSVQALAARRVRVLGIVFNGDTVATSRSIILAETGLACLLDMPRADRLDGQWIASQARALAL